MEIRYPKLVFLGAPGAGKGTQAKLLAEKCGLCHISTGDMLRQAMAKGTELGKQVQQIVESGQLVPDELMIKLIEQRISGPDAPAGYILDGFPRTVVQAEAFRSMLERLNEAQPTVVLFELSKESLNQRLVGRRGSENRADDSEKVQEERLRVYQEQTLPLVEYYDMRKELIRVAADGAIPEVQERLLQQLSK